MVQPEFQSEFVEDEEQDAFEQGEAPTTYVEPVGLIAGGQVKQPRFLPREESVFASENAGFLGKMVMKVEDAVMKCRSELNIDGGAYRSVHLEKVVPSRFANMVTAVEGYKPSLYRFGYLAPLVVMAGAFVSPNNPEPAFLQPQASQQPITPKNYTVHTFLEDDGEGHSYQMSYGVCEIPLVQGGYATLICTPFTEGMNAEVEKIIPIKITSGTDQRGWMTPRLIDLDFQ